MGRPARLPSHLPRRTIMPTTDAPAVEVIHRLGRRVHLRAPSLSHRRAPCQRIADHLAEQFAGHRIGVRPQTGSIIVEAETQTAPPEVLADRLAALLAAEHDDAGRPLLEPVAVERGAPSHLARAVMEAFRGLNDDVCTALEGKADLATLAPVVLAIAST